jgi:heme oxygenase
VASGTPLHAGSSERLRVMSSLRHATATVHARLEARLPLTCADLTLPRYIDCLRRFHCGYVPLEAWLSHAFASCADLRAAVAWPRRRKVPRLEADAAALGVSLAEPGAPASAVACVSESRILGTMYVMEGATLGGQIISRHLGRVLGLTAERGAAFFSGYGAHTGALWRQFGATVEAVVCTPKQQAEAEAAACATFAWLEASLLGGDGGGHGVSGHSATL